MQCRSALLQPTSTKIPPQRPLGIACSRVIFPAMVLWQCLVLSLNRHFKRWKSLVIVHCWAAFNNATIQVELHGHNLLRVSMHHISRGAAAFYWKLCTKKYFVHKLVIHGYKWFFSPPNCHILSSVQAKCHPPTSSHNSRMSRPHSPGISNSSLFRSKGQSFFFFFISCIFKIKLGLAPLHRSKTIHKSTCLNYTYTAVNSWALSYLQKDDGSEWN